MEPSLYLGINERKLKALRKGILSGVVMYFCVRIPFFFSYVCLFLKKKKKNEGHISPLRLIKLLGHFFFFLIQDKILL